MGLPLLSHEDGTNGGKTPTGVAPLGEETLSEGVSFRTPGSLIKISEIFKFNAAYLSNDDDGTDPTAGEGLFNGSYVASAQIVASCIENLDLNFAGIWTGNPNLAFPDLGKEGAVAAIGVGMPPKLTSGDNVTEDDSSSLIIEALYKYPMKLILTAAIVIELALKMRK